MCTLAHDGLLRGGELCTLRLHDLRWLTPTRDAFDLTIHKSKCNKTGPPEVIFLQSYPAPQYLSAAVVVRRYLSAVELVFGVNLATLPPSTPLFPADWRTPAIALSKPIFVDQLRAMLLRAGFPAAEYSGHSFRSGGATDLYHAGCRPFIIQRLGRWITDAWQIYIRDRLFAQRAETAAAFARAATQLPPAGDR